jgi:S1-C subfamily serine protease
MVVEVMDTGEDEEMPVMPVPAPSTVVPSEVLNPRLLGSVVKLFVTKAEPNYCMPWQVKPQRQSVSSAFVVAGRRLITNAHCVLCETSVRARKRGSAKKYTAQVLTVNYQSDLALLSVDDDSFWNGLDHLEFEEVSLSPPLISAKSSLSSSFPVRRPSSPSRHSLSRPIPAHPSKSKQVPELQDTVIVAGYPTGGDNISVTKGVVSRVDLRDYGHGAHLNPQVRKPETLDPKP